MNKRFQFLIALAAIAVFAATFGALVVQAQPAERAAPKAASYEAVLGKSLDDTAVADFISSNRCSSTDRFQLCNAAGMALLIGESQKVETVYLYPGTIPGFAAYKGTLPLGLAADDTRKTIRHDQYLEHHANLRGLHRSGGDFRGHHFSPGEI